jgi:hypothetical protein
MTSDQNKHTRSCTRLRLGSLLTVSLTAIQRNKSKQATQFNYENYSIYLFILSPPLNEDYPF